MERNRVMKTAYSDICSSCSMLLSSNGWPSSATRIEMPTTAKEQSSCMRGRKQQSRGAGAVGH